MLSKILNRVQPLTRLAIRHSYLRPSIRPLWFNAHKPIQFFTNSEKTKEERVQQAKRQGQQFYDTQVSDIIELKQTNDFPSIVQTTTVPLVINFYADWNMGCKSLTPKLESRIKNSGGQLKLLNINIDKFGDVAKVFQVKAVPTIYLVYQGKAIDSFTGDISDEMLGKFIETASRATSFDKGEASVIKTIEEAQIALRNGDFINAEKLLVNLKTSNAKEEFAFVKNIFLAYVYGQLGKISQLKSTVQIMVKNEDFYITKPEFKDLYLNLIERYHDIEKAKEENSEMVQWRTKLEKQPHNLQLKFQASVFYQQNELYEQALIQLLAIVKANKQWSQKKANKAILEIFKKLGNASLITQNYRKLLQRALH